MEKKQLILLGVVLLHSLAASTSGIYLPLFYLSRGIPISGIILLLCATFAILTIVPLFLSGRNTISLGLLFFSLFYFSASFSQPIVVGVLYGLGLAFFWPSLNFLSSELTDSGERAGFLGKISAVRTLAPVFGVLFGGFFAAAFGLKYLIFVSGGIFILSFLLSLLFLIDFPSKDFDAKEMRLPFVDRNFFLFSAGFFLNGFADSSWLVYPLLLAKISGGNTSEIGIASSAITVLSAMIFVVVGKLSDVFGRRKPFLLLSVPFEFIWFFGVSVSASLIQIILVSVSSSLASALMRTGDSLYIDCYEKKHHAFLTALRESALNLGRIASILVLSSLIISGNYHFYYRIFATASLFYIPIYLLLKERHNYA
ncbi:MAG: MFS transporter [archaeon]